MNRSPLPAFALVVLVGCSGRQYVSKPADFAMAVVTVEVKGGSGTGVIAIAGDGSAWVLTAGHVVDGQMKTEKGVDAQTGGTKYLIAFDPVEVVQERGDGNADGSRIAATADVVRYSSLKFGEDLAVLKVRQSGVFTKGARFDLSGKPPKLGEALYHVGSMAGHGNYASLSEGVVSYIGRRLEDRVYDQSDFTAIGGSSGGPVFRKSDGVYLMMLTRGPRDTVNYCVPMRRIHPWLKRVGCEFIVNPKLDVPDDDELKRMAVDQSDYIEVPKE